MSRGPDHLRRILRTSMNRHWLARMVIAAWVLHIPAVAFLAPESLAGRALERSGDMGFAGMVALAIFGLFALLDSALCDILPGRLSEGLMNHRHIGFMLLAICLVITGGGIAAISKAPVVLASFLLPAMFCVAVTWLDLYNRRST